MQGNPRVRLLRRVVLHAIDGVIDPDDARRTCDHVRPGDDVVLIVKGRIGVDPGLAALVGRCLAESRTVSIEADGPCADLFATTVAEAAQLEALEW